MATFHFSAAMCASAWPSVTRRAECQHRPTPILHASQPLAQPSSPALGRHASVPCVKPGGTGPRSLGTNWKEGWAASYPAPAKLFLTAVLSCSSRHRAAALRPPDLPIWHPVGSGLAWTWEQGREDGRRVREAPCHGHWAILGSMWDMPQKCHRSAGGGSIGPLGSPGWRFPARAKPPLPGWASPRPEGSCKVREAQGRKPKTLRCPEAGLLGKVCMSSPWAGCCRCSWSQEDRACVPSCPS